MNKPGFKTFLLALCATAFGLAALAQKPTLPGTPVWKGIQYPAEVVMDATGQESFDTIRNRFANGEAATVSGNRQLMLGGRQTAWLRINLPAVTSPTEAVMTVVHPGLDTVILHHFTPGSDWQAQRAGDSLPVADWPMPYLHPAFSLDLPPGETRAVYMEVRHSSPVGVYWLLWDRSSFDRYSNTLHMVLGCYLGFVLLVVVLSCFNAWNWRDPIHLVYAVYVVVLGMGQLSLTGLAGEYFWPHHPWWNDIAAVAVPMLSAGLAGVLVHQLVVDRGNHLASALLGSVAFGAIVFTVGFLLMGRDRLFYASNLAYLYFLPVLIGCLAWFSMRRPSVGLWALAGFICLSTGSMFPILRNLEWVPINFYTQFGAQIGAAVEIPLVLVALYFRSRDRRDTQVRLSALSRVDPLTGVASHRLLMERLEHLLQRHQRDPQAGAILRVRLVNGAEIRAGYGAALAQAALVRAGACVSAPAQVSDTVGRHNDGDFVLLLEGRATESQVTDVAQRIIAEGLRPGRNLPRDLVLQLHVACADPPLPKIDGETLLQHMGALLDTIALDPRRTLRFLRYKTPGQSQTLERASVPFSTPG
ncbi:MAG: 7TM diverse intracellular signaling domain-containing protein [Pseudomonadota bacterium]